MKVTHETEQQRFVGYEESAEASDSAITVDYRIENQQRMIVTSTYVPVELRGGGKAAEITRAALQYALDRSLTVVPQCSYTRLYLKRNAKKYAALTIEDH